MGFLLFQLIVLTLITFLVPFRIFGAFFYLNLTFLILLLPLIFLSQAYFPDKVSDRFHNLQQFITRLLYFEFIIYLLITLLYVVLLILDRRIWDSIENFIGFLFGEFLFLLPLILLSLFYAEKENQFYQKLVEMSL
ncbi:MAG: hypothetical protein ACXAB7_07530 [Candidatus Kariarchaeaceae archaeon]|jgi:hypothetical protein